MKKIKHVLQTQRNRHQLLCQSAVLYLKKASSMTISGVVFFSSLLCKGLRVLRLFRDSAKQMGGHEARCHSFKNAPPLLLSGQTFVKTSAVQQIDTQFIYKIKRCRPGSVSFSKCSVCRNRYKIVQQSTITDVFFFFPIHRDQDNNIL